MTETARKPLPQASLKELFEKWESPLLLYAHKLVQNNETAQDIVQQAFLNLHPRIDEVTQPKSWLYRTVHNLAMNHHRSVKKIVSLEVTSQESNTEDTTATLNPADPDLLPDQQLEHQEALGLTQLSLKKLKPREREIIQLKFQEELSYKEIAARMDLSISNVGYLLHQTLKTLAFEIQQQGGGQ